MFGREVKTLNPGQSFLMGEAGWNISVNSLIKQAPVPGICVLETIPSIGKAVDRNSPANVAATALYTHVRYMNSGRKNYDQADLMIYGLTAADLYAFINWMIRIYNCAFMFSQRNIYVGKSLLIAQRVNPNIIEDLPAFRYWINVFINKVASYAVPSDIYLYQKRAFMYANVYTESYTGSIKDQLYLYNPAGFYRFTLDSKSKGMLTFEFIQDDKFAKEDGLLTLRGLMDIGDTLLSDMWGDEDFGIMAGDVLRAFDGKIVGLSQIGEEGGLLPINDPFVLHQMKNSTVMGGIPDKTTGYRINISTTSTPEYQVCWNGCVYQDGKGNLISRSFIGAARDILPVSSKSQVALLLNILRNPVISVDDPSPQPALLVEITRNMAVSDGTSLDLYTNEGDLFGWIGIEYNSGDHVVSNCVIYTYDPDDPSRLVSNNIGSNVHDYAATYSDLANVEKLGRWTSAFHYLPVQWIAQLEQFEEDNMWRCENITSISDLQNYTVQLPGVISRLHELSMLSLLYVPGVAKQVNYMK